ncbi:tumor protein p63-regulated gene 1-like protein [Pollicipes pollicipes]|uniref:tumor protein p63-regulated gene 1-like protein n=1 Tax=Pollicipes pollicipes TaxID=41117 RepID=UPI00188517C2|nr:tumor protein p63-regulated gene 1-like protein [Pollicipes pollicipes]
MSRLAPPKRDAAASSDEEVLDDVPIDDFTASTLQLAASPSPAPEADRAVSEEAVPVARVPPPAGTIYAPDGAVSPTATPPTGGDSPAGSDANSKTFFSTRSGAFESAVSKCKLVLLPSDGKFHSAWLLTLIDHWDVEKERLVLLTERALLVIKYDFISLQAVEVTRVRLNTPDRVTIGELTYPHASITPRISGIAGGLVSVVKGCLFGRVGQTLSQLRQCAPGQRDSGTVSTADGISFQPRYRRAVGVRISWDCGRPLSLAQNWNPLARDIPFITLTSHSLFWDRSEEPGHQWERYSVQAFSRPLLELVGREQERPDTPSHCVVERAPIVISNYVGVFSLLHNATDLGFFKNRGRVSF